MGIRVRLVIIIALLSSFAVVVSAASAQEGVVIGEGNIPVPVNTIRGQVMSVDRTGNEYPLSSEAGWGLQMDLYRFGGGFSEVEWVNGTGCSDQGRTNRFGEFAFYTKCNGDHLENGDYDLEVTANGHTVSRTSVTLMNDEVLIRPRVPLAPVFVQSTGAGTQIVSPEGGEIFHHFNIWNLDSDSETIQVTAMIYGPTKTQVYGQYQVEIEPVPVPEEKWQRAEGSVSVKIPNEVPNRRSYCVNFRFGPPDAIVAETWQCAWKWDLAVPFVGQ